MSSVVTSFGLNSVTYAGGFGGGFVAPGELAGAMLKLQCGSNTYTSTMTTDIPEVAPAGGIWEDGAGNMVGKIKFWEDVSTYKTPMKLDITMVGGCPNAIFTIDLRPACGDDIAVVFDINDRLYVREDGCHGVPVFADWQVGFTEYNDGQPRHGRYQFLRFDFGAAGCDLDKYNPKIYIDSDRTDPIAGVCIIGSDGDPHIKTFSGKHFDYMGECDMVLLHAPDFDGQGKTLDIHTRTKIARAVMGDYSFIESAAIKIDDDILEVSIHGDHAFNGVDTPFTYDGSAGITIGGYPIYYTQVGKKKHIYDIVLSPKENITLGSWGGLVSVHMNNAYSHQFLHQDVTGVMGSLDGSLLGRDGSEMSERNTDEYAEEWQVREDEPMLFRTARYPQYPHKCVLPPPPSKDEKHRRLEEATITREDAEQACSHFFGQQLDNCIYDVLAVRDLEAAEAGAY